MEKVAFAAGCFWGVQQDLDKIEGVSQTVVGYMGGQTKNPTYESVKSGKTGHAETVMVQFDPKKISFKNLLKVFWGIHDPTSKDAQGGDVGSNYRSIIFYSNKEQSLEALRQKSALVKQGKKIVTEIIPINNFYKAEEYHQKYFARKN